MGKKIRKMKKVTFCMLCLFLAGVSGCTDEEKQDFHTEDYTIGVVAKSRDSEYWMSVYSGMEAAAAKRDVRVVFLSPDSETDKKEQKTMIYDLLKMDVDALAVSPIDSFDNEDYLKKAEEQGILIVSYDTPIEDADVPYVGIDNEKAGYELAEIMAEALGNEGEIAVISGDINQASHKQRVEGFLQYMKQKPNITVQMIKSGYSNLRVSEKEMEEIRSDYPKLSGIMATSAVTALGLAEATQETGMVIASFDVQEDAISSVEEGGITALVNQSGYDIGYSTIEYIVNEKEGVRQGKNKILETDILTQEKLKK